MSYKWRMLIAIIFILAICWIDYSRFTEAPMSLRYPDHTRKLFHIIFLIAIIPIGYFGWSNHPIKWLKKIWLTLYILGTVVLLSLGFLGQKSGLFSAEFLKNVGDYRLFFCSPVPFFILYVLSRLKIGYNATKN